MTTNRELVKEKHMKYMGFSHYPEVNELMNLARADERKLMMKENTFIEGYNKGCFETKEKIKNSIIELYGSTQEDFEKSKLGKFFKELSCPEMEVTRVASGYNITPKDNQSQTKEEWLRDEIRKSNQSHQNKGLNTSEHSARVTRE